MGRPAMHKVGIHGDICIHFPQGQLQGHEGQCLLTQYEALEFAKELLDVCDGPEESTATKVLTFSNPIISSEVFKGRLLVLCKSSIWEIFEGSEGELKTKKISCIGIMPPDMPNISVDEILSHLTKSEATQLAADILSVVTKMKESEI